MSLELAILASVVVMSLILTTAYWWSRYAYYVEDSSIWHYVIAFAGLFFALFWMAFLTNFFLDFKGGVEDLRRIFYESAVGSSIVTGVILLLVAFNKLRRLYNRLVGSPF